MGVNGEHRWLAGRPSAGPEGPAMTAWSATGGMSAVQPGYRALRGRVDLAAVHPV